MERGDKVSAVVARVMAQPGPLRLVAIDGPGGSGKSTFAGLLSAGADGAPIIHTDDFGSADNPVNWWPRLLRDAIEPLVQGNRASYQRYDWSTRTWAEWCEVLPSPIIVIEGVSAGRQGWLEHLSLVIWMETPSGLRRQRVLDRDGAEALDSWQHYTAAEDAFYRNDPIKERADIVVDAPLTPQPRQRAPASSSGPPATTILSSMVKSVSECDR